MWRTVLFLLCTLGCSYSLFGQTVYQEGRVLHAVTRAGLDNVIWKTQDSKGKGLHFGFSKAGGDYRIPLVPETAVVEFRLMGYATKSYSVADFKVLPRREVLLAVTDVEIPEVRISLPPITRRADTIRYNAESFRSGEDRYVADLLKKLPGISMGNNGTVYYQGEAISRFYIEGRDLLGGQYGIASQNMPVDAVSSVEVLESHQHIKALQDVARPAKAALNIRLKDRFKFRPFGEIEAGGGGYPWIYKGRVFLGLFNKALQFIFHAKGNNTGDYILEEMDDKLQMSELFFYNAPIDNKLSTPLPRNVEIAQERHLFHQTYLASLNTLVALNAASELKLNATHGSDWMRQEFRSDEVLHIGESLWNITERSDLRKRKQQSRIDLHYEYNGDRTFLQNDLILQQHGDNTRARITNHDTVTDKSLGNLYDIQNRLSGLYRTQNRQIFQFKSLLRWQGDKERLKTQEAISNYLLDETLGVEDIFNRNQLSSSFHFGHHSFSFMVESEYHRERLAFGLATYHRPTLRPEFSPQEQQVTLTRWQLRFIPNYSISFFNKMLALNFSLPVVYSHYQVVQNPNERKEQRPIFLPTAGLLVRFNYQWEFNLSGSRDWDYCDEESLISAPYFLNYRNIYVPSGDFHTNEAYRAYTNLQYKNPAELFFWNIRASYWYSHYNYLPTSTVSTELTYSGSLPGRRTTDNISIVSDFTKNFLQPNLSLTFTPQYNVAQSPFIRQGVTFRNVAHLFTLGLNAEWRWAGKLTLTYNLKVRGVWNQNRVTTSHIRRYFDQNAAVYYFPISGLELACKATHTAYEHRDNEYYQFYFLDASVGYKYKKWGFALLAHNLLDLKRYSTVTYLDVSRYWQELPLRGREFLVSVKYSF